MNKKLIAVVFAIGLGAIAWVGWGFADSSWLALAVTGVIAAVYLLGAYELRQFRCATATLAGALNAMTQPLTELGAWLALLHPSLQNPVRLRIEGERVSMPGPTLTPYLVGLLVMLGMLGTFLGMVVTFKGAVFALEGSADLFAIRSALAAPIKGLGLSFGTSVAGVAASAMLGLMSALSRRERMEVLRQLDTCTATVLRPFSLKHQQQETLHETFKAMPVIVDRLQTMIEGLERRTQHLDQQLLSQQQQFHGDVRVAYTGLAQSVGQSLHESLNASARAASENIQPLVVRAMAEIADATQAQLTELSSRFETSTRTVSDTWAAALRALRDEEALRGAAAVQRLDQLQAAVAEHLTKLGASLEIPLTRLLQTAHDVPQAAAGVIAELRQEMHHLAVRNNAALEERAALLSRIGTLLETMDKAARQFTDTLGVQTHQVADVATHVASSAVELTSLGEAFGHGVQLFNASNEKLIGSLQRIEGTLGQSMARSDEQLAYYVAQAREVIDLSITSQQGIMEDWRRLHGKQTVVTDGGSR
ncbi:MAG: hypothetical protein IPH35_28465 [Rhodoferax sp.]|nr:hypothetical protein [Rhodoferax sp.]